mgnify:CR=1 FL=1
MNQNINFKIQNCTGIIHLNRPKVLNALNLEMVELLLDKLKKWKLDFSIKQKIYMEMKFSLIIMILQKNS